MIQSSVLPADLHVAPEIEAKFEALLETCRRTLPSADEPMLRRAFRLAYWAHRDMTRASGEPYVTHPIEVARIYAEEMGMDDVSVAAALLHDVIEDTEVTLGSLRENFGDELAGLVDGLTKIRSVAPSREVGQAENVRKLMLSMASDLRVIFVKFADRLHNMRTIRALRPEKRKKIAAETLELFAPLAHRFGLARVKTELEDRSLAVLDPLAYAEIEAGLAATHDERAAYLQTFTAPLDARLREAGLTFRLSARPKTTTSIYRKMKRQEKALDEIYDLMAVRVVLDTPPPEPAGDDGGERGRGDAEAARVTREKEVCWRAYSVVTGLYRPLPDRLHDYVSVPKSNGYQSLHTTVIGPDGRRVEVQIRTQRMHEVAERGVAAHWKYKEGVVRAGESLDEYLTWVQDLLDSRDEGATDFVRDFRLNLYDTEIYVFTPKGRLITLPTGATPVDFAFQVHTEVGLHCIGAKANGRIVPLSHRLQSGDQVEVITSKKQTPNPDWMKFVVTHKAQTKIRHWVNEKRRAAIELGRTVWEKRAKKAGLDLDETALRRTAGRLRFSSPQDMFYEIGAGLHDADELVALAKAPRPSEEKAPDPLSDLAGFLHTGGASTSPSLIIEGEPTTGVLTEYAACCNPIPGDEVFGYVAKSGTIKIHRTTCPNALDLLLHHGERTVKVEWSRHKDATFATTLRLMGEDRVGIVSDITTVISRNLKTNIRSITVDSQDGIFEGRIALYVADLEHLRRVMDRLRRVEGIHGVYRLEGGPTLDA